MSTISTQSIAVLKALADPMRLEILAHFMQKEPVSCGDIRTECPLSQPTVSHHMACLVKSGLLLEQKDGTQKMYRLNKSLLQELGLDLSLLIAGTNQSK
jgi:ArsR family transcriptional regulator